MTCDFCPQEAVLCFWMTVNREEVGNGYCLDCVVASAGEDWGPVVHRLAQANVAAAFELGRAEAHEHRLRMAFLHNLPRWTR